MYVHILNVTSCLHVPVYSQHSATGYHFCNGHITKEELLSIIDSGVITSAMSCTSCSASISVVTCALLHRWLPDLGDPAYGDDGLDALACAWSAARIATGTALTLPAGEVPSDLAGRPMRICA